MHGLDNRCLQRGVLCNSNYCCRSCFCSLLIYLNVRFMKYHINVKISAVTRSDSAKVCFFRIERICHSHIFQSVIQFYRIFRLELWNRGVHLVIRACICNDSYQLFCTHLADIIAHADSFLWKQCDKAVTFFVRSDKACRTVILQIIALCGVHHIDTLAASIFRCKSAVLHILLFIRRLPFCIKGNCVDQIHHRIIFNLIQYLRNHLFGLIGNPRIDIL